MHIDVIILVKEKEKDAAIERVEDFLEPGYYTYWDYYEILEAVPLVDCLKEVKEMCQDNDALAEEAFEEMVKFRADNIKGIEKYQSAYYAYVYSLAKLNAFSFASNVYDLDHNVSERVPDDIDDYWAVKVDLHH